MTRYATEEERKAAKNAAAKVRRAHVRDLVTQYKNQQGVMLTVQQCSALVHLLEDLYDGELLADIIMHLSDAAEGWAGISDPVSQRMAEQVANQVSALKLIQAATSISR